MRSTYLSLLLLPLIYAAKVPQTYINTAIARTIELGGATTQLTTQYNVKALTDGPGDYILALAGEGDEEPSWWEVSVGGKSSSGLGLVTDFSRYVCVPIMLCYCLFSPSNSFLPYNDDRDSLKS